MKKGEHVEREGRFVWEEKDWQGKQMYWMQV